MNLKEIKKIIYSILRELTEGECIPNGSNYEITEDF